MNYHVRISLKSHKSGDETKNDFTEELLREKIIEPYELGEPIIINGKTIQPSDIDRIKISKSQETSGQLIQRIKADDRKSSILRLVSQSDAWRAASIATDVTDELILGHAGYKKDKSPAKKTSVSASELSNNIFIVHGHNISIQQTVARTIEKLDLNPIILQEQPNEGKTIIEKFEYHSDVGFAIVLLTDDDEGKAKNEKDLKMRARQNVVLELGYFIGKLTRSRVLPLYSEGVELPNDIHGLLYTPLDKSGNWKFAIVKELKAAGYSVDANKLL